MATVEFNSGDTIPGVCLCCGQATRQTYRKRFVNFWGKSFLFQAPLCPLHRNHFYLPSLLFSLGFMVWALALIAFFVFFREGIEKNLQGDAVEMLAQIGRFGLALLGLTCLWFLGLATALAYLRSDAVRLGGIKSGKLTLLNVATEFAEALRVHREAKLNTIQNARDFSKVQNLTELFDQAEPLADDARRALELAGIYARVFNHDYVGTDHLLLGLRRVDCAGAGKILKNCLLPAKLAEMEVQNTHLPAGEIPSGIPVTPYLRRAIGKARAEAQARKNALLGTGHILLGLLSQEEGLGAHILETFGLDFEELRKQVFGILVETQSAFFPAKDLPPEDNSSHAFSRRSSPEK